ncbi:MAG TPA: TRAP transporter substrate-binding protein [Syntrophorhabdaceae bacterium]|nr:TRAP transporter substrate-binding protein [Syntrophorhabdaceae bacterium]
MKKCVILLLAATFMIMGVFSSAGAAEAIKLKAANYLPATHPMSLLTGWFCDEVKKRTNGQVEITYYPGGTLLNPVKMYDGIVTGIADMGVSHISYTRGRFPVMEAFEQPLGFPSGWVATQVTTDFYNKYTPKEWSEVQVLYINTSGPLILQTVTKPVKTLQDLKGLKIRATGRMSDVVKAMGAVPIPLEMGDVYDSLRRNVIEGVTVDLSTLKYWKFADVVKYVTADWQLGTGYTFYFVMNKKKWDALPDDVKKVFTQVALEAKEKQASLWNEMDIEGRTAFKAVGGQIITLSNAEAARWIKAVQPVFAAYKKEMVSKGFKEAEIDGWISYIKERTAYWKAEEKKRAVPSPFE